MVGRNDSCPCGSGKKYKKCCFLKNEISVDTLNDEALDRVLMGVYEQAPNPVDGAEFNKFKRQWMNRLGDIGNPDRIEEAVSEYFLFIARPDLWKIHLVKTLNSPVRDSVRSVLDLWRDPFILFGKIVEVRDDFYLVKEVLGNGVFHLEKNPEIIMDEQTILFGVVLPDNRKYEHGIFPITSLTLIQDQNSSFEKQIESLAESSGFDQSIEFYKAHMIDIYELILSSKNQSVSEPVLHDLTPLQQEVMSILEDKLESQKAGLEARNRSKNILASYLVTKQPNFRKPEIIAAAAFQTANDLELFENNLYTQTDIAKLFSVSVGSMMKHADNIHKLIEETYKQEEGSGENG